MNWRSLPGSSVHEILQVKVLEWVAIPFFRGSSQPRDWTQVSCSGGRFFIIELTREALSTESDVVLNKISTLKDRIHCFRITLVVCLLG